MQINTSFFLFLVAALAAGRHCPAQTASAKPRQDVFVPAKPEDAGFSSERLARIDKVINAHVNARHIPGAVVFIARNGKLVYNKTYGYSDAEKKVALKSNDIFRIASQTKAITSLAVMLLWEEGKFQLDDSVSRYIPEFRNARVLVKFNEKDSSYTTEPAKTPVTIRQLLTHTSGIEYASIGSREFNAIYAKAGVPSGIGTTGAKLSDKMKILASLPLEHQPGEKFTYGLNLDVLGYLVEVLSGMSLDDFFRERIFKPLGMNDTYFYLPKEKQPRLVKLYENSKDTIVTVNHKIFDNVDPDYPKSNGGYYSGGAGLNSTVEDYAKFLQLFLNGGKLNNGRLLSRKTVELMLTNQIPDLKDSPFGLGFGIETEKNDHLYPSTLGTFSWGGAFGTAYWVDPKEKIVALIYTNIYHSQYGSMGFRALVYQALTDE